MEYMNDGSKGKKRDRVDSESDSDNGGRVDSGLNSPETKRARGEPELASHDSSGLFRVDSDEPEFDSPESTRVPNDILDMLDGPDTDPDVHGLESVMRSFEEEILFPSPASEQPPDFTLVPSGSSGSLPDLGYLLEASDDELGLPPAVSPLDEHPQTKFDENNPSQNSLGLGVGEETQSDDGELAFEDDSVEYSGFVYRPDAL